MPELRAVAPAGDDAAVEALRWVVGGRGGHTESSWQRWKFRSLMGRSQSATAGRVLDLRTGEIHPRSLAADTDCLCLPGQAGKIGGKSIPTYQIQSSERFHGEPGLGDAYLIPAARKRLNGKDPLVRRGSRALSPVLVTAVTLAPGTIAPEVVVTKPCGWR